MAGRVLVLDHRIVTDILSAMTEKGYGWEVSVCVMGHIKARVMLPVSLRCPASLKTSTVEKSSTSHLVILGALADV